MDRKSLASFVLAAALTLAAAPALGHDYDRDQSDHPLRVLAYIMHPVGVVFEYAFTRPFHWLAHRPHMGYIVGHEVTPEETDDTDITCSEECPLPEPPDLGIEMSRTAAGVHYTIVDGPVLFASGSAQLSDAGKALLDKIAASIQQKYPGQELAVEGHTDTQPIRYSPWKSNWELGTARALAIVQYLASKGFDPVKITTVSYGEFQAAVPNDTPENMAKNRRAVITVKAPAELPVLCPHAEAAAPMACH